MRITSVGFIIHQRLCAEVVTSRFYLFLFFYQVTFRVLDINHGKDDNQMSFSAKYLMYSQLKKAVITFQ